MWHIPPPFLFLIALMAWYLFFSQVPAQPVNPAIDAVGYQQDMEKAMQSRESRRLSPQEFAALAASPGSVMLDARSFQHYANIHITGAVNLPYTDMTATTLARVIPSATTPILIYCNNNFDGDEESFARKSAPASLNLATWTSLTSYGYTNIYELAPVLAVDNSPIPLTISTTHAQYLTLTLALRQQVR